MMHSPKDQREKTHLNSLNSDSSWTLRLSLLHTILLRRSITTSELTAFNLSGKFSAYSVSSFVCARKKKKVFKKTEWMKRGISLVWVIQQWASTKRRARQKRTKRESNTETKWTSGSERHTERTQSREREREMGKGASGGQRKVKSEGSKNRQKAEQQHETTGI